MVELFVIRAVENREDAALSDLLQLFTEAPIEPRLTLAAHIGGCELVNWMPRRKHGHTSSDVASRA